MRFALFLILHARGNEEVKGCLEGRLRIVGKTLPTIPAGCPQRARRVGETVEGQRCIFIRCILKGCPGDRIRDRIVQEAVGPPLGRRTPNTTEARLHDRLPLTLGPGGARLLDTECGIHREGCRTGAIRREGVLASVA